MTTGTRSTRTATRRPAGTSRDALIGALGVGFAALLTAVATFHNNEETGHTAGEWFFVLGVIAVAAAVVFGFVVRTAPSGDAARRSLVLGVLSLLTAIVFWSGLPFVLAAGAVACALHDRERGGRLATGSTVGLATASLAAGAAAVLAFVG